MKRSEIISAVRCRHCGVRRGEPCRKHNGARVAVHRARLKDAIRSRKTKGEGDEFYFSWEWRSLRYEVMKEQGRRCSCCGWKPTDGGHNYLVVDHILPRRTHPSHELDKSNLQVLCNECNMGKGWKSKDDFRKS